jgi:hypothetical protein
MGGVLPGEEQAFLDELHPHTLAGQALGQGTQVIEVARDPVHAVHDGGVPVPGEAQEFGQLWSGRVPAGGLVREDRVQDLAVELASFVLVQGAQAHVTDPLSSHTGEVGSGHDAVQLSGPGLGVLRFHGVQACPFTFRGFHGVLQR